MSSCCGSNRSNDTEAIRDTVRDGYTKVAEAGTLTAGTTGCCCGSSDKGKGGMTHDELASKLGYEPSEIESLPEGANMGLSCGNPAAIAALQPGQTVLDLGSGGGFDCFLAGPKVGDTGRVIGVDMTPAMLSKARTNIAHYQKSTGLDNVEFRLGEIEHLPVADGSADVVISNCVINLSPDKLQVWREIARVLKPGGIAAVSDIVMLRPLPEKVKQMAAALVGCVAGAVLIDDYRNTIESAGLSVDRFDLKPDYIKALSQSGDPLYQQVAEALPEGTTPADYIASADIRAIRK